MVTQYYKSHNYGGNLQAYALCRYLNDNGFKAEQISYERDVRLTLNGKKKVKRIAKDAIKKSLKFAKQISMFFFHNDVYVWIATRNAEIDKFNSMIPHSEVYTDKTMNLANEKYDMFIAGSDQVWLPQNLDTAYFLGFADLDKRKIAYAASLSVKTLSTEERAHYKANISNIDYVSVREEASVALLSEFTDKEIHFVLDPVFLLNKNEWEDICSKRIVSEDYVFCYFLGNDSNERNLANEYAEKNHLKLVTMPHLQGKMEKQDLSFGDLLLYNTSPIDFLSLIENAKMVFTDSFHAVAFSLIFEKQFFVFGRNNQGFGTRISSICTLARTNNHYLDTADKQSGSYIADVAQIDYPTTRRYISEAKEKSVHFLIQSLLCEKDEKISK